jgi:threonine dehydrogenase-like Zn-dependent dehydrogenase
MRALVRHKDDVFLETDWPTPAPEKGDDVVIRVRIAGLCRTDLYVVDQSLPTSVPLVLGHEFSGTVEALGPDVEGLARGDNVTARPLVPCGACALCRAGWGDACRASSFLGLSQDGAFADYVRVPARVVHRLPKALPFYLGAYAEPVAAALAVLKAGLSPTAHGLVAGDSRVSALTLAVLRAHGFASVESGDVAPSAATQDRYDFIVETEATTESLAAFIEMARPGGTIVLKSRSFAPIRFVPQRAVMREITFRAVNYGDFDAALALIASGRLDLEPLCGACYAMADYRSFFAEGRTREDKKIFLAVDEACAV